VLAQPMDQLRQQPDQLFLIPFANYGDANHGLQCNGSGSAANS
jgi:hypothetical protein